MLVHAAGFMPTGDLRELDPQVLAGLIAVTVRARSLLLNVLAPAMGQWEEGRSRWCNCTLTGNVGK